MKYPVVLGVDRQDCCNRLFAGARLGLITSSSGISAELRSTIDLLRERYDLRALFAPEHGIRGVLAPGEKVKSAVDRFSGLPTHSLFEDFIYSTDIQAQERVYQPSPEAMSAIDMMVFDLQDVGSRYYTYPSTLFYAMKACAAAGKALVVLDRPNPIGGSAVEGNCHSPELLSFIGLTQTPIRHGWTLGEMARYYNGEYSLGCALSVVELSGWERWMYYNETNLYYVNPSPNLPTMESVVLYNGTCLLAGTNVSDGRGTTTPFSMIGAPYINPEQLAKQMNRIGLAGLAFTPAYFMPRFSQYQNQVCQGVTIHVTQQKAVQPVALGVFLIRTLQELYPEEFCFTPPLAGEHYHIDLASGNRDLRENHLSAEQIIQKWDAQAAAFQDTHARYCIYQ